MSLTGFARIFGEGAVLQRGKDIRVWGFAGSDEKISVSLAGSTYETVSGPDGRFDVTFPPMEKGGPYVLLATDPSGGVVKSNNIMIGDVLLISGQSNMEYPMENVRETYPSEWDNPNDPMLRSFKVTENGVFTDTLADVETGEWKSLDGDSIDAMSAVGYFTAKNLRMNEDVAVGLVDVSLGGAPIEAFMSRDMLEGYDRALNDAAPFTDEDYRRKVLSDNEKNANEWLSELDANDTGLAEHFEDGVKILEEGRMIAFPDFFSDTELAGFTGSVWIARTFDVPKKYAGKKAKLWFGIITDLDYCYVNGKLIGNTEFTYPSRRYKIPEGLTVEGENTVVFRIGVEKGYGKITPGRLLAVIYGDGVRTTDGFNEGYDGADHIIPLGGVWKYLIGYRSAPSRDQIFVNWKPTALFYGMLGPLAGFAIKAFVFYQGESNCGNNSEYADLTVRFVEGLRKLWSDDFYYICVQLPEFGSRMEEISYDGGVAWRGLMKAQEKVTDIPGAFLVRAYGTGELNDLHPQRKAPLGAMIAETIVCRG